MASAANNVVLLKGDLGWRYEESRAGGTIKPGELGKINSSKQIIRHATAGGHAAAIVVLENRKIGTYTSSGITGNNLTTAYASGDLVPYMRMAPGMCANLMLKDGINFAAGDKLVSAGDGSLKKWTSEELGAIVAEVRDAVDLTSAGANTLNPCWIV